MTRLIRSIIQPSIKVSRGVSIASRSFHVSKISLNNDPQLGDYPQVPAESRQMRTYDSRYFDTQEKQNFGENLNEQDDILGVFAPDVQDQITPGKATFQLFSVLAALASFAGILYFVQPDPPALPRTYQNGLMEELGGSKEGAARSHGMFDEDEEGGDEEEEEDGDDD